MTCLAVGMAVVHAFRRMALPLTSYYAVTLALPLAHGARSGVGFARHALVVLVVPLVAIVLGCAVHTLWRVLMNGAPSIPRSLGSPPP